jgi:acyl-coenzyme A thioesterase PaaI-like protein
VVRTSAVTFVIDAVAGISVDTDPNAWSLTTDLSLHMQPTPAPSWLEGRSTVVRHGRRSVTCTTEVVDDRGRLLGIGALGFARVPRQEGDPPKPNISPADAARLFDGQERLDGPVREEAGIRAVDPANGVVEVEVVPELRNSAGTLQGAMVALIAEAAAEDLVTTRFDGPAVVTDLDLRYLGQARGGSVRTRSLLLGDRPDAPLRIELVDAADERMTTLVFARAQPLE